MRLFSSSTHRITSTYGELIAKALDRVGFHGELQVRLGEPTRSRRPGNFKLSTMVGSSIEIEVRPEIRDWPWRHAYILVEDMADRRLLWQKLSEILPKPKPRKERELAEAGTRQVTQEPKEEIVAGKVPLSLEEAKNLWKNKGVLQAISIGVAEWIEKKKRPFPRGKMQALLSSIINTEGYSGAFWAQNFTSRITSAEDSTDAILVRRVEQTQKGERTGYVLGQRGRQLAKHEPEIPSLPEEEKTVESIERLAKAAEICRRAREEKEVLSHELSECQSRKENLEEQLSAEEEQIRSLSERIDELDNTINQTSASEALYERVRIALASVTSGEIGIE